MRIQPGESQNGQAGLKPIGGELWVHLKEACTLPAAAAAWEGVHRKPVMPLPVLDTPSYLQGCQFCRRGSISLLFNGIHPSGQADLSGQDCGIRISISRAAVKLAP